MHGNGECRTFAPMKNCNRILYIAGGLLIPFSAYANFTTDNRIAERNEYKAALSLADSSRIFNLDEVVVVSQPKESSLLRNQPMASTVFSTNETAKLGIRDITDVALYVPSFQMPAYGSRLTSSMYIRGIGSRVNNPAVGVYLDGMPLLSKSAYNVHTYQLDRIDVLRGPQGTLYGMNTEGGLVRLYSKNPMTSKGTDIKLGIGSRLYRNFEFANYSKLSYNTAMSVAGFYSGQNGFLHNTTTGERADSYNEAGGKIRIINQYSNHLSYDFIADYQYANQNAFPYGSLDIESGNTSSPSTNRDGKYKRNMLNAAFNIKYIMPGWTFNSTTSYQFLADRMNMDQDYTALDFMHLRQKQLQNGITQEFAVKGNNGKNWRHTSGLFGSYQWMRTESPVYFDTDFTTNMANTIQTAMYNAMVASMANKFINMPGMTEEKAKAMAEATIARAGGVSVNSLSLEVPGMFHTPQFNLGVFHESSIDLTKRLTMTIGLRYDYSRTKIDYNTSALMTTAVNVMGIEATSSLRSLLQNSKSNDYNQVLPKLGFTWKIDNSGSNVYAIVSKGYRSGGYNIQMFSDILQTELRNNSGMAMREGGDIQHTAEDYEKINSTISYKPEFSWNYELGSHLNLFNNTVQADLSAYYMKIRNQQLSVMAGTYGFGRMMVNAGRSHSCGLEASLRGMALDNRLSWCATYSYTRSIFDNYKEENKGMTTDYKDNYVPFIPQHTFSVAADWSIPFNGNYMKNIVIGANTTGQGKTYWDEANSFSQKFYALLGAHADIVFKDFTLSIWSRNITSTKYNTFAFSSSATGKKLYHAQSGNPFQIGVDIRMHF